MIDIAVIGVDAPVALLAACGFRAQPLHADDRPTPRVNALMGGKGLGPRGRSLLEQMLDCRTPMLVTRADTDQLQVFAILRELARLGEATPPPTHLYDLRHFDRDSSHTYNDVRTAELIDWLLTLGGTRPAALPTEAAAPSEPPTSTAPIRVYLAGTRPRTAAIADAITAAGAAIGGNDWSTRAPLPDTPPADVATRVIAAARAANATHLLHLSLDGDEAAPWDVAALRRALPPGLAFAALTDKLDLTAKIVHFLRGEAEPPPSPPPPRPAPTGRAASTRSRKSLDSIADFSTYQREWFAGVRAQVAAGAPFALVNANAPQEILRTLDIPFVVNQWWASIVAAKQQSRRYMDLLKAHDFPTSVEPYSAQALAAAFDQDADNAPWGGLPKPDHVHAIATTDATPKIFAELAHATGAKPFIYERTVDPRWDIATDWWADLPDRWDEALEPARIDIMVAEMRTVIARLESSTGRSFDHDRFVEIMHLVNEQEEYYRRTRDMIAAAPRAPIGIVDSMPATMVPQWHRGTVWARDAAKAFHDEVARRIADGAAVCPDEQVRLMWVGRGMWSDMAFVQRWEDSHGAVFVWSMYLALAADGYIRNFDRGRDPLRALAARFITMGDELRLPSWGAPWHVHEALTHRVDGAVALADADPFAVRALERAGIPVLPLDVDNFAGGDGDLAARRITDFIEGPAGAKARARRGA